MKKRISILMLVVMLFSQIYVMPVYALDSLVQSIVRVENETLKGYEKLLEYAGMIIDPAIYSARASYQFVKDRLVALGLISSDATAEDVQEYFDDNITQNGSEVGYSSNLNIYIKSEMQQIQDTAPYYYAYSGNVDLAYSKFNDANRFYQLKKMCRDYQDRYLIRAYQNNLEMYLLDSEVGIVSDRGDATYTIGVIYYYDTWQQVTNTSMNSIRFQWDSNLGEYVNIGTATMQPGCQFFKSNVPSWSDLSSGGYFSRSICISSGVTINYKLFRTLNDFKASSLGSKPYYTTPAYYDYQSISGSYNTNTDNSISYGDVTNYINNYYNQNEKFPSDVNVQVWIDNGAPNSGGGGSGGGDSGVGGSGGDSGSGSSIWDFLSRLGEVLSGLISNLGNMLTSLIESIVTIINDVVGKIPQVFNGLLEIVFGGLPEDMRAIIILGITVMVVYGIIKVIRG